MPELIWKGKAQVVNHHLDVPVQTLDRQYDFNCPDGGESGNKIIHGDNLAALKALLPQYEGKVKCIYIDPPYNTGNESWVYNDNVKDPRILKWLGEVVGKEGEDLCRHDKWLCMMYPRLQLLKRLLAEDGSIWISIDDVEAANLRLIMDEIFGSSNFVTSVIWEKADSPRNSARQFSTDHDYVLIYSKQPDWIPQRLQRTDESNAIYQNPDNDPRGAWIPGDPYANKPYSKGLYTIIGPSGREFSPPKGRYWRISENKLSELNADGRIWWGPKGNARPSIKRYLNEVSDLVPRTLWSKGSVGSNRTSKNEMRAIFSETASFDTPKPSLMIERMIQIGTKENDIILDSFAGSGTTAHAVLNLNNREGGNRKFILIEMMDYAETITAERVKRVINGYGEESKAVAGTDGDFSYYSLGERVFDDEGNLNEALSVGKIREYVAWSERLPGAAIGESPYWLGEKEQVGYYFFYDPTQATVLNLDFLATLTRKTDSYLIYADTCLLDEEFMRRNMIRFKKIPRDISRF
ncbi:MAG: site-specific DNA-methyltransferase [Chlorobium sp.]|jgi:adenine-specific DNA-methyltransferase|nr:site-specific DNA-methyltransferase [Chlorobium sp.]